MDDDSWQIQKIYIYIYIYIYKTPNVSELIFKILEKHGNCIYVEICWFFGIYKGSINRFLQTYFAWWMNLESHGIKDILPNRNECIMTKYVSLKIDTLIPIQGNENKCRIQFQFGLDQSACHLHLWLHRNTNHVH